MSPGLRVVRSNRMERLVDALAEAVAEPLPDPLAPEVVVVQNRGMARWLSQRLAARFGVWMNARFPFPAAAVAEWFDAVLGTSDPVRPWEPDVLVWRILDVLPGLLERPGFDGVRRFLEADDRPARRYRFASRIADLFDRYTVYRPDWVLAWEAGGSGPSGLEWQAELWRAVAERIGGDHRARRCVRFLDALSSGRVEGLPHRVQVFGLSALPPFHLDVLSALARQVPVTVFLLDPCREWWADVVSPGEAARRARAAPETREYYAVGNRLLASLGRSGREFLNLLWEREPHEDDRFEAPDPTTALGRIQCDLLGLVDRGPDERLPWPDDGSIRVASCHGPLREAEALRDHLLALFERWPDLTPEDVVVMTPDLDTYGPLISAVFRGGEGEPSIPHSLADRAGPAQEGAAAGFLRLLEVARGRLRAPEVLDLLEWPALRRRFGWDDPAVERVRTWVAEAGIRWGRDAAHRHALGLGAYGEHSWRFGLDRLLLGRAMAPGEALWQGVHPFPDVEGGGDAGALEGLARFVRDLFRLAEDLARPRSPAAWGEDLSGWFERFFRVEGAEEREVGELRRALVRLGDAGDGAEVAFEAVAEHLASTVGRVRFEGGFLAGGVTVCALLPMRSVPFRVVCLVGLNDGSLPRTDRPSGFDGIARQPRRGDRSLRDEDRYLFLEALLSARDHLYLSYVGQSSRDNAEVPPSVLVSELLDALDRTFDSDPPPSDRVRVRHRLHPFSPAYFRAGGELQSYSAADAATARRLASSEGRGPRGRWVVRPLPEPPDELRTLSLDDLERFFRNPCAYFLRVRLGVRFDGPAAGPDEAEPLEPQALSRYGVAQEILDRLCGGEEPGDLLALARAQGRLPPGAAGPVAFRDAEALARGVWEAAGPRAAEPPVPLDPRHVDLGPYRLHLRLPGVRPGGLVLFRPAAPKGKDRVRAWIRHLALCALRPPGVESVTVVVGRGGKGWTFGPVDQPEALLMELLELYGRGLREPLPFAPETSWAYAHGRWGGGRSRKPPLDRAREAWAGSDYAAGEGEDPALAHCFGEAGPFGPGFEETAEAVFGPSFRYEGVP
ncbi:exodeoxyribonuclease V subunit gamma [Deferrisoma camini]|uniref:exodeoxyribonuclease V subunit gamma n=1 Tax=Deferrisoma camini TaxID=1035120 RepID=UPI0004ACB66F|nr:exodeoxyribonuclease V subunit gamma [Deferrisoma camini]